MELSEIINFIRKKKIKTQICKYKGTNKFLAHSWPSNRSDSSDSVNQVPNLSLCFVVLNSRKRCVCKI